MAASEPPDVLDDARPRGIAVRVAALWKALRPLEVALMTAFPLAGLLIEHPSFAALAAMPERVALCFGAGFAIAASAFGYNRLTGIAHDRHNVRHMDRPLVGGTLGVGEMRVAVAALAVLGIVGFALYHPAAALGAIGTLVAGFLYSSPVVRGKERPGLSTLLHVVGAVSFFYAGLGTFGVEPLPAVTASAMALLFATGHFHHELLDIEADRSAGLNTVATRYGARVSIALGTLGFAIFYALMGLAWSRGWWPGALAFPFVLAGAVHAVGYVVFVARLDHPRAAYHYRSFYRALFLLAAAGAALGWALR